MDIWKYCSWQNIIFQVLACEINILQGTICINIHTITVLLYSRIENNTYFYSNMLMMSLFGLGM